MIPPHTAVPLQRLSVVVVHVQADHFRRIQSLPYTAEAAARSAAEAHVVDVVRRDESHHPELVVEVGRHAAFGITVLRPDAEVDVGEKSLVHPLLHTEIQDRRLVAVVDARHTGEVALLVVGLYGLYDGSGEVLHGGLRVAHHELFSVDENLLHFLAVDLDCPVVRHLRPGQLLHQCLDGRPLRCAVGRGVVLESVGLHDHLRCARHHLDLLQRVCVCLEVKLSDGDILLIGNRYVLEDRPVAYIRCLQDVSAVCRGSHLERTGLVGSGSYYVTAVLLQQLDDGKGHVFLHFSVIECSCNCPVLRQHRHGDGKQEDKCQQSFYHKCLF